MLVKQEELQKCNACGFCQAACPVYRITRHEGSSSRGHHAHLKALLQGTAGPERSLTAHFGECLTCRACTANCPTALKTDRVVVEARSRFYASRPSPVDRFVLRGLLSKPGRLRRWAHFMRLLPLVPKGLLRAADILPHPAGGFLHQRIRKSSPSGKQQIAYFMSCGMNYLSPDAGEASLRVLKALGREAAIIENVCCGLPAYVAGDLEAASAMARQNLAAFADHEGLIVTDCASCSSFLKEYPTLLGEEAKPFAARVRDFTEFVAEVGPVQVSSLKSQIVTYHDPCHLSRYQNLRAQPREILKSIPGVEYRELPEADWCCGGAGTYSFKHARLSEKILERKMENVRRTGATILATACPACIMQLSYGAKKYKVPVKVVHISQLLAEALTGGGQGPRPTISERGKRR